MMIDSGLDLEAHTKQYAMAYAGGALVPEAHNRLVPRLHEISRQAHIPQHYITHPISQWCGQAEVDWLRHIRRNKEEGIAGLCLHGKVPSTQERMMAMAGALIRNFIDARVLTVEEVFQQASKGNTPDCSVLLVPNFHLPLDEGGVSQTWKISALLSVLMERYARELQTVIYVSDLKTMQADYGQQFHDLVSRHYNLMAGGSL